MLLTMLILLCVHLAGCTTTGSPIIVVKGVDYDDGTANDEPKDKTKWMWMTYDTAKRQLSWVNHHR